MVGMYPQNMWIGHFVFHYLPSPFGSLSRFRAFAEGRVISLYFERSEFLIDTPHKKNLRVCPSARVK